MGLFEDMQHCYWCDEQSAEFDSDLDLYLLQLCEHCQRLWLTLDRGQIFSDYLWKATAFRATGAFELRDFELPPPIARAPPASPLAPPPQAPQLFRCQPQRRIKWQKLSRAQRAPTLAAVEPISFLRTRIWQIDNGNIRNDSNFELYLTFAGFYLINYFHIDIIFFFTSCFIYDIMCICWQII